MYPSSANPVADKTARKVVTIIILMIVTAGLVVLGLVLTRRDFSPDDSYLDGERIEVLHTETSDSMLADTLSKLMNSPVIHVPSLAQAPATMLANLYIVANGKTGLGTRGFQPDVLDNPPRSHGYSPLRAVWVVTWVDPTVSRELTSVAQLLAAQRAGEVRVEKTNIVINTPLLSWPKGKR